MERKELEDKARILVNDIMLEDNVAGLMRKMRDYNYVTFIHSLNVGYITAQTAVLLKLDPYDIKEITEGGLLHDIGKLLIPKEILCKNRTLTPAEYSEMKKHPEYGLSIVESLGFSTIVKDVIYSHHEKNDGSGYPKGLKKAEIPLCAKIVGVVDAYDAMTSERPYKMAYDSEFTLSSLREMQCYGHYIIEIVESLIAK